MMVNTRALNVTMVYDDVHQERDRAHGKHGPSGNSRENRSWLDGDWLPVLMEDVGKAAHELTYGSGSGRQERLRAELVQVAAMACAWIDAIDSRDRSD